MGCDTCKRYYALDDGSCDNCHNCDLYLKGEIEPISFMDDNGDTHEWLEEQIPF